MPPSPPQIENSATEPLDPLAHLGRPCLELDETDVRGRRTDPLHEVRTEADSDVGRRVLDHHRQRHRRGDPDEVVDERRVTDCAAHGRRQHDAARRRPARHDGPARPRRAHSARRRRRAPVPRLRPRRRSRPSERAARRLASFSTSPASPNATMPWAPQSSAKRTTRRCASRSTVVVGDRERGADGGVDPAPGVGRPGRDSSSVEGRISVRGQILVTYHPRLQVSAAASSSPAGTRLDGRRLDGRVAIVTGAGQGHRPGDRRAAAPPRARPWSPRSVRSTRARSSRRSRLAEGAEVAFVAADVRDEHDAERLVAETVDRYGRVDVLCNNAGVGLLKAVTDTSRAEYDDVLDTNLWGLFTCSRFAIPHMVAPGRRLGREHRLGRSHGRLRDRCGLLRIEGRGARAHAADGTRLRTGRDPRELRRARGSSRPSRCASTSKATTTPTPRRREVVAAHPMGRMGRPGGGRGRGRRSSPPTTRRS